jgi:hypothetical protein
MSDLPDYSYSTALVSYIDILGFGDLVSESRTDPARINRIVDILTTMKEELAASGRSHQNADGSKARIFRSFNFSDLIVRCTRTPDGVGVGELIEWELFYLGAKQLTLASQGVLVRGGICLGDLIVTVGNDLVFGPALVRSYKLESQYAIYPRIIIDQDLIAMGEKSGEIDQRRDYLQRGDDGAYYVDYMFGSCLDRYMFRDPADPDPSMLIEAHRTLIETALQKDVESGGERVRQKYVWLALYHNSALKRLRDRLKDGFRLSKEFDRLVIDERLLTS